MSAISGTVQLRPVRVALATAPELTAVRRAVQLATSAWGGLYFPLVASDDAGAAEELARVSASDVIVAVEAKDVIGQELADLPGFRWKAGGQWGPFEAPVPHLGARLLGPETNLRGFNAPRVRPTWQENDPLAALYATWFGEYGTSGYEVELRNAFDVEAEVLPIVPGAPFSLISDAVSPVVLTSLDVDYAGVYGDTGIVVLNPDSPADLISLWNLRALGNHVFPWPLGHEARFREACGEWLRAARAAGKIHKAVQGGTGAEFEVISTWLPSHDTPVPDDVASITKDHGLVVHHGAGVLDVPPRSRASHFLETSYTRRFSLTVPDGEYEAAVPLPTAPFTAHADFDDPMRTIAVQISIAQESGLGPGRTFTVPASRRLSPLLDGYWGYHPELFSRPSTEGRVLGVSTIEEQVRLRALPTEAIFEAMLDGSNWTTSRSPSGRFATQLISLLGGAQGGAGNQPAVRRALDTAARSPHGKPIAALIDSARRAQGAWPDAIVNTEQATKQYPERIVRFLLARKILRPALPVECPHCATTAYLAPEALTTDYSCQMCEKVTPLGLILSLNRQNTWCYKTATTLTGEQIAETMPIMAAANVLRGFFRAHGRGDLPYVLGLKVTERKVWECEIDIVLLGDNGGAPLIVIGEVKSYQDPISETDLANLGKVQQYLRLQGIECVILAATLRERIEGEELLTLRSACENAPATSLDRFAGLRPVLPLVLTARDLSAPEFNEYHPNRWGVFDIHERAEQSCRRNLGLKAMVPLSSPAGDMTWRFSWADESGPEAP
jgi:hypothetical protein